MNIYKDFQEFISLHKINLNTTQRNQIQKVLDYLQSKNYFLTTILYKLNLAIEFEKVNKEEYLQDFIEILSTELLEPNELKKILNILSLDIKPLTLKNINELLKGNLKSTEVGQKYVQESSLYNFEQIYNLANTDIKQNLSSSPYIKVLTQAIEELDEQNSTSWYEFNLNTKELYGLDFKSLVIDIITQLHSSLKNQPLNNKGV
ncbi:hypothetical protein NPA08_00340 [Mycoplasmopsis citelli]|uniref:hypothetical protein n=1 Tax=Mycoplasmopsis citelli TaxID=171281 RepID=UPI002114EAC8|nr:hypothetical protein [Mycoplasmopsis citelli]UUD36130.1 hypothetical protein NPA08_04245 [Mycoplasmopsis citelli]UUD36277.1 hypothetical protein NPA08_00340 [Mycoplasmopsis citelli]